ncbi:MAG TPA: asparagine synthase (glutamine-hydrolyzing) [Steroidobacteraceae bacterium]|nr:asparagine synthase (glutamine-hydrolyzing) [Steroidobacteraceae bacterium]
MCGIAGAWDARSGDLVEETVHKMLSCIVHRGPDDSGVWVSRDDGVGIGQRRLAIQDLSSAGHQPMLSNSGRLVLVLNGEIYNHLELREELEAQSGKVNWRGHSDTETLLALLEAYGTRKTLEKIVGMFAIALWDRKLRTLTLARDRVGEKPLYFGRLRNRLYFGSELKTIRAVAADALEIDRAALTLYMRHNYVPSPGSIYRGVFKLAPGTFAEFSACDANPQVTIYWSAHEIATRGLANPFQGSDREAIEQAEALIGRAVSSQLISDVPLGAFLSGGIDSSLIVALMQAHGRARAKTFTIGFSDKEFDEAQYAKKVAAHLGTDHTELYVTPEETRAVIPLLPEIYDEPFADSSQIPTYLVSKMARNRVTVSLSGDAGDELFGGYTRYLMTSRIWNYLRLVPRAVRGSIASYFAQTRAHASAGDGDARRGLKPPAFARLREKTAKLAENIGARDSTDLYYGLLSHWKDPASIVINGTEPLTHVTDRAGWLDNPVLENHMMFIDLIAYLPDDILVKVDRAAMRVALETRVPFLDHRVVEFAWTLPMQMKIRDGKGKWLLRQLLDKYVPRELFERPKTGFGIPIDYWLRGPLREWAAELLNPARLTAEGFFNAQPIGNRWAEHLSGSRNWGYYLWDVLMFQAWLENTRKF